MRASDTPHHVTRHLSGAEKLVEDNLVHTTVGDMVTRAKGKHPDQIQIRLERVPPTSCKHARCLPVHTVHSPGPEEAADFATKILVRAGVNLDVAVAGLNALRIGLGANGSTLRGASLWDKETGRRLEPDPERGVRTSRFDYSKNGAGAIDSALAEFGLTHFRTREALAVATKTLWSGVSAELCWSDDPDYATGYVATPSDGYVRLPGFKPTGAPGGRIFFVDSVVVNVESLVHKLEREYLLIDPPVWVNDAVSVEEFIERE